MNSNTFFFSAAARAVLLPSAPDRSADALLRILLDAPRRHLQQLLPGCPRYQRTVLLTELVRPHAISDCSAWAVSCEDGRVEEIRPIPPRARLRDLFHVPRPAVAFIKTPTHDLWLCETRSDPAHVYVASRLRQPASGAASSSDDSAADAAARVGVADRVNADPHVELVFAATAETAAGTHDARTMLPPRGHSRFPNRLDQRALSSVP